VFGLNVVLAVLAILGALRFIPESADPDAPPLDLLGSVLTVAGLGVLVYSISNVAHEAGVRRQL